MNNLKTPSEFVDYYWTQLEDQLQLNNIQVSKVGFVGYMLSMLGFTQYDVKQYYDHIFNEAFPITADEIQNLYFHSALYGYIPPIATPATLVGNFKFNLNTLPEKPSDVVQRDIYLDNISLAINNLTFNLESTYHIVDNGTSYICNIQQPDSQVTSVAFSNANPVSPIIGFNQHTTSVYNSVTSNYNFSTYDSQIFSIPVGSQLDSIDVLVNNEPYKIEYVRTFAGKDDKVVFVRYFNNSIIVEFGSGIHGIFVPNTPITVTIKTTLGTVGNIGQGVYSPTTGYVRVIDTHSDGTSSSPYSYDARSFLIINVSYGYGGKDLLDSETLRQNLVQYIQNRKNLISENDFRQIYQQNFANMDLVFKKVSVRDNDIYNHVLLSDRYENPYLLNCVTPLQRDMTSDVVINNKQVTIFPEFANDMVSPFIYMYDPMLRVYNGYLLFPDYSRYFDNITLSPSSILANLPPSSFEMQLQNDKFVVYFKSYQSIDHFIIKINIPSLNVYGEMVRLNENVKIFTLDFFIASVDIEFDVFQSGVYVGQYLVKNVNNVVDMTDFLCIKRYIPDTTSLKINFNPAQLGLDTSFNYTIYREPTPDDTYLINIPVISKNQFNKDTEFILSSINTIFSTVYMPGNRMISDQVQIKFLNTSYITSDYIYLLTKQQYDFDIKLPLKLTIDVYVDKSKVPSSDISVIDLNLSIASLLASTYTGTVISFYNSKLLEYIHDNFTWVKHCDILVTDSNLVEIPNSDIETISNGQVLKLITDKFMAVKYIPVYWWWDINNITINLFYE